MRKTKEKRKEQRLCYDWPIRFFKDLRAMHFPGRTVDLSSEGMAFICHADKNCPRPGQEINTRFSVPRFGPDGRINQVVFTQRARTCRVDEVSNLLCRVAIQFAKPLFFKPGEQDITESDAQEKLEAVTVTA